MQQMTVFDFNAKESFKIKKPIRLIELFAGVGSQAMALRDIGAKFEHYRMCEIDKYAVKSYNAIHGTSFEPTDITKLGGGGLRDSRYRQVLLYLNLFVPVPGLIRSRKTKRYDKGKRNKIRIIVGSRATT